MRLVAIVAAIIHHGALIDSNVSGRPARHAAAAFIYLNNRIWPGALGCSGTVLGFLQLVLLHAAMLALRLVSAIIIPVSRSCPSLAAGVAGGNLIVAVLQLVPRQLRNVTGHHLSHFGFVSGAEVK